MKTPNERIQILEDDLAVTKKDLIWLGHALPWAVHKAIEGLFDLRKINYAEKRIIWEAVSKEITESLAHSAFLGDNIEHRLREIESYSKTRR